MAKKNSIPLRADPEFAKRVERVMEEDNSSQRVATRKIERQIEDMERRLKETPKF